MVPKTKNDLSLDSARSDEASSIKVPKTQDLSDASAPAGVVANGGRAQTGSQQVAAAADISTAPKPQEGEDEVLYYYIFFIFKDFNIGFILVPFLFLSPPLKSCEFVPQEYALEWFY